jgi:hypothetical protein
MERLVVSGRSGETRLRGDCESPVTMRPSE